VETYIAAIDQGTTSSRCIVFDGGGNQVALAQREHRQHFPRPGWVEHDAEEIWANVEAVVAEATQDHAIQAIGITNQRETTLVWDRATGRPVHHAIVWQDTRTGPILDTLDAALFTPRTGLPLATYFAGPKLRWLLDNVDGLRDRGERGEVLFGTMDSWLIWKLTGRHVTDVTNASRTLMMDLRTLDWDDDLLAALDVPRAMLPRVHGSSEVYGHPPDGTPVAGALGDQQAALFGQTCFQPGEGKSTYGTGTFLLVNTGATPVTSRHGLLTTVGYRIKDEPPAYALEGSIAVTGALVQWLRQRAGDRGARRAGRRQRRLLCRTGLLRALRTALAQRRPGRDRRPDRVHHQGAHRPRGAGGDGLADPRGGRRDERGHRRGAAAAAGRRRDDGQRAAHADPRRRAGPAGRTAAGGRDDLPRRGLRGRPGGRLLARPRRAARPLAARPGVAARHGRGAAGSGVRAVAQGGRPDAQLDHVTPVSFS
jgi:sugar (pentulose or hexulose) kinase